jgi:hypothetical protein
MSTTFHATLTTAYESIHEKEAGHIAQADLAIEQKYHGHFVAANDFELDPIAATNIMAGKGWVVSQADELEVCFSNSDQTAILLLLVNAFTGAEDCTE